ncbi:NAD(P)-binding protein [Demequina soli]|uniref:NAD(P)-binding protein n=1 Tax=Demequina soli TaxID=1638987 RepID=UPI000782078F|nr:NAD(P)-binding protein [Demequina soli]
MTPVLDVDYLVVGAGATGLAFADSLVDHSDATVAILDRADAPGGHWRQAYPFVRLHQSSTFYGVASAVLGGGIQESGPEAGLHERATGPEVVAYFADVARRLEATGRVTLLPRHEHLGDGLLRSLEDGAESAARPGARIVDAHFLSPTIPATTPPPFAVEDGARVIPVGELPDAGEASAYAIVGSGKTATDAIVWLLTHGVDPGAIRWIRPRDPWMLDRAMVQPDAASFTELVARTWEAAAAATSLEDLFLRLEDAGVMLRIDRATTPTMAKTPTLGRWELDLLREVEDVVRLGHLRAAGARTLTLDRGEVTLAPDTLIVHCAADGLPHPDRAPVWDWDTITLQPIRAGFPCFGAALAGYVEATRDDDAVKNALCPPNSFGNSLRDWAVMTRRGALASARFLAEPDIRAWADGVALNPARIPPGYASAGLDDARERIARTSPAALDALARLAA